MRTSLHLRPLALTLLALPLAAHDTEEHKVLASDGVAGDGFGRSISLHESTMAVGAPFAGGTGAVYVFTYDGVDWTEEGKLVPSDGVAGDHFGRSVSVSHETIIVGAPQHGAAGAAAGAAYVFVHDGVSWNEEAKLQSSTIAAADAFGSAVTLDDDTAVVGAPRNVGGAPATGSAFVFVRSGTIWTEEAELTAADGVLSNQFGASAAVHHDTLVVGASRQNGVAANSGAAYVYDRAGTVWSQTQKLRANDGAFNDFFGASVAMFEDELIVVGSPGDDDTGKNAGSTYQFNLGVTSWQAGVKRFGSKPGDVFGNSVAHSYRTTIVGSRLADSGIGTSNTGVAYLYANFGVRTGFEVYVASDPAAGKWLGSSVAMTSCLIGVGAMGDSELGAGAGAVYTYVISHPKVTVHNGSGVNPLCMTTIEPPVIGEHWEIEVDASAFPGGAFTLVVVHAAMRTTPQVVSFGEILVARRSGLVFSSVEPGAGINLHEFLIPLDPYLTGLDLAVQGLVRSGVSGAPILGACNAEFVRIGCEGEGAHHTP